MPAQRTSARATLGGSAAAGASQHAFRARTATAVRTPLLRIPLDFAAALRPAIAGFVGLRRLTPRHTDGLSEVPVQQILSRDEAPPMTDTVLIIDFGSQVTQLIARRVREQGVYSEIVPFNKADEALERLKPKAVILSGGPASVTEFGTPRAPDWVFKVGLPVLGICYGEQTMVAQMGGGVEGGHHREFGRAELEVTGESALFDGVWKKGERDTVWMSHGDRVTQLPPGFKVVGISKGAPFAAIADEKRKLYAVQFHPEVAHTPRGSQIIGNFVRKIAGLPGDWSMAHFRSSEIAKIRAQVGKGRVICG